MVTSTEAVESRLVKNLGQDSIISKFANKVRAKRRTKRYRTLRRSLGYDSRDLGQLLDSFLATRKFDDRNAQVVFERQFSKAMQEWRKANVTSRRLLRWVLPTILLCALPSLAIFIYATGFLVASFRFGPADLESFRHQDLSVAGSVGLGVTVSLFGTYSTIRSHAGILVGGIIQLVIVSASVSGQAIVAFNSGYSPLLWTIATPHGVSPHVLFAFAIWVQGAMVVMMAPVLGASILLERIRLARLVVPHCLAISVRKLIESIHLLRRSVDSGNNRALRHVAPRLLTAAQCIDVGLYRRMLEIRLSVEERVTIKGRLKCAGDTLRSYRMWVLLPRADTAEVLAVRLADLCDTLLAGRFDELPAVEMGDRSATSKWRIAGHITKTVTTAATPTILLEGFGLMKLDLPSEFQSIAILFCLVWATVTILMSIDPLLRDRISITSDILSMLKGRKNK